MYRVFIAVFYACCFSFCHAAAPSLLDQLEYFYDEFLCEEKAVLATVGIGHPCQCGVVPYPSNTGNATPQPILFSPQVWSFVSEPDLHPMKITVNVLNPGIAPGFIFVPLMRFLRMPPMGKRDP